jgi:phage tail-like protein
MTTQYTDPYRAYNFKVVIQGVTEGHFTECSGLNLRVEPIRYREAGNNQIVHAVPGRVEYGDVTLRYGLTSSRELWDWMMASARGAAERKNVSILMLDNEGSNELMRWDLINAWPSELETAHLDASSNEAAIQQLTLAFDSIEQA